MTSPSSRGSPPPPKRLALLLFGALCVGFLALAVLSFLPLLPGTTRTMTFAAQDVPPYVRYASFTTAFWMNAGESVKENFTDTAYNETSGAVAWRGPALFTFLHLPLNQSGPVIAAASTAPADGYYILEVQHTDCQTEAELCALPFEGVVFTTSGTVTILGPRPYPYLVPSGAVLAEVASLAGFSFAAWFAIQARVLPQPRVRDVAERAVLHPLVIGVVAISIISGNIGGLSAYYGSQLTTTQIRGLGSLGFVAENPCIPGLANHMLVWAYIYNSVDEKLNIQLEVLINGTAYFTGANAGPRDWSGGAVVFTTYTCRDPVARIVVLSAAPG